MNYDVPGSIAFGIALARFWVVGAIAIAREQRKRPPGPPAVPVD